MPACKLLIVDDDEDIRESLIALLQDEGYEADGARTGLIALSMITWGKFIPDVILLDLWMPSMSGDQLRNILEKDPEWSQIPIILCSAGDVPETVTLAVFGVLEKPFDMDRLLALVKSACAARRMPPG
jgi:DNA-binding NtrC family response regulator